MIWLRTWSLVWLLNSLWLGIPFGSLIVGILAICNRFPRIPHRSRPLFLAAGWVCLVLAGVGCRDVMIFIITLPLIAVSLGIAALLWRSAGIGWSFTATFCYWMGVLAIVVAVIHMGMTAALVEAINNHVYAPEYLPSRPRITMELFFGAAPVVIICVGLILSRRFGRLGIIVTVTLLSLLNPAILLLVAWLQPPMSM